MVRSSGKKKPHRVLMEFRRTRMKSEETELIIYNEQGTYSDDYKALTQSYYLAF